jgi:DNA-directed RNA polymerase alpha subunit
MATTSLAPAIRRICLMRVGYGRPREVDAAEEEVDVVSLHLRAGLASLVHTEGRPAKLALKAHVWRGTTMSAEAVEMVTIPRAELDSLKAELRRLRREVGRTIARARIQADHGSSGDGLTFTRDQLAEAWGIRE